MAINGTLKKLQSYAIIGTFMFLIGSVLITYGQTQNKIKQNEIIIAKNEERSSQNSLDIARIQSKIEETNELVKMLVKDKFGQQAIAAVVTRVRNMADSTKIEDINKEKSKDK